MKKVHAPRNSCMIAIETGGYEKHTYTILPIIHSK